ncbi:acetolactate synthase small subunit [Poseidonibacter ostreae]|jgi:acetolactate synthase I/III small subunit|uniref:Acetolactate synthase small subunit n=1 Tax=Poseidonibacter ostreae TaxID=2654171 RepID=A0A6L4WVE1_9BACT|nr:acetolactate synthase small subunit [Poseidonibacter ostreae]KAB7886835.1 acetolactate synthase small subunit [Poseidonibacter ostreae]KAB7890478.1 acetolactate synthase small subunit [Poseidonibacter ostreae]KAB7890929.1 acetolactate synthase small subunit [Poseidonibacter ostreae]MAC82838.1 acetolactate synthase small subunit [Arcobacter sp.]|tara:strand:+ start:888 stop:1385 length:498 start_codon:yes stop_codon:yes gene_type:complete
MNNFNHYYDTETTRQVISVVVMNEHNVLSRIVGLFSARGYNIDSLTVAPMEESKYSRMTIVTTGDKRVIDQIVKQLNKLIPVLRVNEHRNVVEKDTVLMKFSIENNLSDIDVIARAYHGSIQNVTDEAIIVSATDSSARIMNFIKVMQKFNPLEVVRSGIVAMER